MCKRFYHRQVGCRVSVLLCVLCGLCGSTGCARATRVVLIPKDIIRPEATLLEPQPRSYFGELVSIIRDPIVAAAATMKSAFDASVAIFTVWRSNAIVVRGDVILVLTIRDGQLVELSVNAVPAPTLPLSLSPIPVPPCPGGRPVNLSTLSTPSTLSTSSTPERSTP